MAMLHMPDTDTASYIIKGRSPAIGAKLRAISPAMLCISVMTRAELLYGLKRLLPEHRMHIAACQLLKIVRVLPWDSEAAGWCVDIRHQLVSSGKPIGEIDMMIAAYPLAAGAVLVTNNQKHFKRIRAPLTLLNWSDG